MTTAIKGFHYGQSKNNELQQLLTKTLVIGVVTPVLAAVVLSQKLSASSTDSSKLYFLGLRVGLKLYWVSMSNCIFDDTNQVFELVSLRWKGVLTTSIVLNMIDEINSVPVESRGDCCRWPRQWLVLVGNAPKLIGLTLGSVAALAAQWTARRLDLFDSSVLVRCLRGLAIVLAIDSSRRAIQLVLNWSHRSYSEQ